MYNMEISIFSYKLNVEVLILIGVIYLIIIGHTFCGCCNVRETFVGSNTSPYDLSTQTIIDTSLWSNPDLTITKGKPISKGAQDILNRPSQPIPLPNNEMLLFANTSFKPECCPNTYSNSAGCACMTTEQYNWLKSRGGNNVPYSEY